MSNETILEPVYFSECRKALAAYYTGAKEKGASFLIKNIPGKLYKAGLFYDGISTENAVDLCTSYAANRSYLIKQGASPDKAGDMALDEMLSEPERQLEKQAANMEFPEDEEPMTEQAQHEQVAAEYELTVFPSSTGAIYHKQTGIALATSLQIRSNSPDAMFYIPQQVELLMQNIMELVNSGHYAINYQVLAKEFRDSLESQGLPPKQANELDSYFGEHPAKQGNATPKGNNQAQSTRPAQNQPENKPTGKLIEITGVELIQSKNGDKVGYKFLKTFSNNGNLQQVWIMSGGLAEYRTGTAEVILKAIGLSAETIGAMEIGDKKQAKNNGVMAEVVQEQNPNNPQHPVNKIVGYHLPDGKIIK